MDSVAFTQADCLLGSNTFDGLCHQWAAQQSGCTRIGCARCAKAVGEEALDGGRDGDTNLGLFALPDGQHELGQVPQVRREEALDGEPCYRNGGLRCLCLPGLGVLASDAVEAELARIKVEEEPMTSERKGC